VLKTEEEILGLPALSLGDLLATDMADFFSPTADATPFSRLNVATQTASVEGNRIAALLARTDQAKADADAYRSAALIELSRKADALAKKRGSYPAALYDRAQADLYRRAVATLR